MTAAVSLEAILFWLIPKAAHYINESTNQIALTGSFDAKFKYSNPSYISLSMIFPQILSSGCYHSLLERH